MPTGQKSIAWTQENVSKLFGSILVVHDIKIDYDAVAKAFGSGINGAAVARYITKFRAKARKNGQILGSAPVGSLSAARGRKAGGGKKAAKAMNNDSEEDLDHEKDDESDPTSTPPQTPIKVENAADKVLHGRVTKRISPRKNEKKNYKQMGDPFVGMDLKDDNGEQMFENKGASSEDSDPTDTEFGQEPRPKSTSEVVKNGEAI